MSLEQQDTSLATNSYDTSESNVSESIDQYEASESGVMTQMEEDRFIEAIASSDAAEDFVATTQKKKKSRRLTKRVAHSIKKQWKSSDKGDKKIRSVSPSQSGSESKDYSDSEENSAPGDASRDTSERGGQMKDEMKKKHNLKFKPVAKAAAKAAKKVTGKKSSSTKKAAEEEYEQLTAATAAESSAISSRPTSPTDGLIHARSSAADSIDNLSGKTPMNTPITTSKVVDPKAISSEQLMYHLPAKFTEEDEEREDAYTLQEEKSMEFPAPNNASSLNDANHAKTRGATEPATVAQPTEEDMIKVAEAMAMAVEKNPTKSHEEIRRMVLSQPSFVHLRAAMDPNAAGSTNPYSSSSKRGYMSKITSGAGKVQKGLLKYATAGVESTLGSSVSTTFGGFMGTSTTSGLSSGGSTIGRSDTDSSRASIAVSAAAIQSAIGGMASRDATKSTLAVDNAVTTAAGLVPPATSYSDTAAADLQGSSASLLSATSAQSPQVQTSELATAAGKAEPPVKLTCIAWKRRSGFGVLRSSPWERRRFVLQGNSLSYYRAKGETDVTTAGCGSGGMDDTERFSDESVKVSSATTKQRMWEAIEQASAGIGLSAESVKVGSEKQAEVSSARGSMDLVKENATICATLGHSGAPSPFCLSIRVKGETKWKLSFATHRAQLQWLAAMTDTVVQASVDAYNIKLLIAADPANHDVTAAFQSHVSEPPVSEMSLQSTTDDGENLLPEPSMHLSGRRLWMMEPYIIKAQNDPAGEADDESTSLHDDIVENEDILDDAVLVTETEDINDAHVWSLPEQKLAIAAVLFNGAILYARNSTTSAQAFWTAVALSNMILFSFLEKSPKVQQISTGPGSPLNKIPKQDRIKANSGARLPEGARAGKSAGVVGDKTKKENFVPEAGTSALRIKELTDPPTDAKGNTFIRWRSVGGEELQVRSHGYLTTKVKIGSPGSLYECSQMDVFESPSRYRDVAPRVKLPKLSYPLDPGELKTWKAPDHFIVSLALPTDPPKLGSNASDGGGYTVTMYFTMRKSTRDILKRVTADGYDPKSEEKPDDIQTYQVNAVRLFEEWCRRAPNDKAFLTRFKMIPLVNNAKEIGLPSWIGKYNGKPLLIKRPGQTGFLLPHPELSCIEFDISLHVFPYLAKQGICYLKDTLFSKLIATVGFVIEGRHDDELPEVVIGLGQICFPGPENVMKGADYFSGKAPRSFESNSEATKTTAASAAAPAVDPRSETAVS